MHWQNGVVEIKGREILLFYFYKNLVKKVTEKLHKICQHFKKKSLSVSPYAVTYCSDTDESGRDQDECSHRCKIGQHDPL